MKFYNKMLIIIIAGLIFITFFNSFAFAFVNENTLKYRYYIKLISAIPDFNEDLTIQFENFLSLKMLENEVENTSNNYDEVLNTIETKNSSEIIIYDEYLRMLKEKLASRGIFSERFNKINYNSGVIYSNIFNSFSFEFAMQSEYISNMPEIVRKTKRIFPYIYSKSNNSNKEIILKNFLKNINENNKDTAQDSYKKAVALMNQAYLSYTNEKYPDSCKAFEESMQYWENYLKLSGNEVDVPLMRAMIKSYQGNSAVEYDTNYAHQLFNESISNFSNLSGNDYFKKMQIHFINVCIGEIFYRKNDMNSFMQWMNSHLPPLPYKADEDYSDAFGDTINLKFYVINYEWNRLSQAPSVFNNSSNGIKTRKSINDAIKKIEKLSSNTLNNYKKKFIKRYKNIMNSNSISIKIEIAKNNDQNSVKKVYATSNDKESSCEVIIKLSSVDNIIPEGYSLNLSLETKEATFENHSAFFEEYKIKSLRGEYGYVDSTKILPTLIVNNFKNNQAVVKFKYTNYAGDLFKIIAASNPPFAYTEATASIQVWKKFALKLYGMKNQIDQKDLYPNVEYAVKQFKECFIELETIDSKEAVIPFHKEIYNIASDTFPVELFGLEKFVKENEISKVLTLEYQKKYVNVIGCYKFASLNTDETQLGFYWNLFDSNCGEYLYNKYFNTILIPYDCFRLPEDKSLTHELGHAFGLLHGNKNLKYEHGQNCPMHQGYAEYNAVFCDNCKKIIKNNFINIADYEYLIEFKNKVNHIHE